MFFDVFNNSIIEGAPINSSLSEGAPVTTWESTEGANQKFIFEATTNANNSVYIKSLSTGKYLQIKVRTVISRYYLDLHNLLHYQ